MAPESNIQEPLEFAQAIAVVKKLPDWAREQDFLKAETEIETCYIDALFVGRRF